MSKTPYKIRLGNISIIRDTFFLDKEGNIIRSEYDEKN